jgi:hypothetical protein
MPWPMPISTTRRPSGQNDRLRHLLRQVQRMQLGRRSEKFDPDQLNLALEDLEQAIAESEAEPVKADPRTGIERLAGKENGVRDEFLRGGQVRIGLPAGGNRIRTISPARNGERGLTPGGSSGSCSAGNMPAASSGSMPMPTQRCLVRARSRSQAWRIGPTPKARAQPGKWRRCGASLIRRIISLIA